jgi:hypothetical protein
MRWPPGLVVQLGTKEIGERTDRQKDKKTTIKCRSPYPFMVESIEMSVIDGRS